MKIYCLSSLLSLLEYIHTSEGQGLYSHIPRTLKRHLKNILPSWFWFSLQIFYINHINTATSKCQKGRIYRVGIDAKHLFSDVSILYCIVKKTIKGFPISECDLSPPTPNSSPWLKFIHEQLTRTIMILRSPNACSNYSSYKVCSWPLVKILPISNITFPVKPSLSFNKYLLTICHTLACIMWCHLRKREKNI